MIAIVFCFTETSWCGLTNHFLILSSRVQSQIYCHHQRTIFNSPILSLKGKLQTGWCFRTWLLFFHSVGNNHHPNWRTHIFQKGRNLNHQPARNPMAMSGYGHEDSQGWRPFITPFVGDGSMEIPIQRVKQLAMCWLGDPTASSNLCKIQTEQVENLWNRNKTIQQKHQNLENTQIHPGDLSLFLFGFYPGKKCYAGYANGIIDK